MVWVLSTAQEPRLNAQRALTMLADGLLHAAKALLN